MAIRTIIGIVAFVCGIVCAMTSGFVTWEMMDKVNEKLPPEQRFSALWWYAEKYSRLRREYRRLYPGGRLFVKTRILAAGMILCFVIAAWTLGFFRHWR
jgi:hypothetical protein